MKKAWHVLFGHSKNFDAYRGVDRRDNLASVHFLSYTGLPLAAMEGNRRSQRKTGEFGLGD